MVGIILLGESNSGKSTIGKEVAKMLKVRYISSGDIARKMSEDVRRHLNNGGLAPEEEMREEILKAITSDTTPFMLDGFPRFCEQYDWLNESLEECEFIYVIVDVPRKDILRRSVARQRDDDKSIMTKIGFYDKYTKPMIMHIIRNEKMVYTIKNPNGADVSRNIELLHSLLEDYFYANDYGV